MLFSQLLVGIPIIAITAVLLAVIKVDVPKWSTESNQVATTCILILLGIIHLDSWKYLINGDKEINSWFQSTILPILCSVAMVFVIKMIRRRLYGEHNDGGLYKVE